MGADELFIQYWLGISLDNQYTDWYTGRMDNRSTLLKCALDLFAARGYDGVGVQEIVEAAGVTKPTLYHYFGSKQGLLQALLEEIRSALAKRTARGGCLPGRPDREPDTRGEDFLRFRPGEPNLLPHAAVDVVCPYGKRPFPGDCRVE